MGREFKELRRCGRQTVKKHYGLLLVLCVLAVMIGTEFSGAALFQHVVTARAEGASSPTESEQLLKDGRLRGPGSEVFRTIAGGDILGGIELSNELEEEYESSGGNVLGHTDGVLASVVDSVTSGHLYIRIIQAILTITKSPKLSVFIFAALGFLVYALTFALIQEPYAVIMRRMFLEARTYESVPFHHAFHLKHAGRWARASMTMLLTDLLLLLWSLTIAGGFIKRYSYFLVPYISAENPDIRPLEAINLSRRMMDGHKWEAFKLEMTFFGWFLLGVLTMGILHVFYYIPYKIATLSEYYAELRGEALTLKTEGAEMLDDHCLFAPADPERLEEAYRDIELEKKFLASQEIRLTGKRKFFAENLGIWTGSLYGKQQYQEFQNRSFALNGAVNAIEGRAYPDRLDPRLRNQALVSRIQVDFLRCYTIPNLFLMFFMFAFIGWAWEVIVFLIQNGTFVNRGSLYGPWVPIYGAGGALILIVVCKLRTRPVLEFFSIMAVCGVVEYLTSYVMEKLYDMRWWDYSGYFLNLNGRICAEGLFAFAALGCMLVYFLGPQLDNMLMRANQKKLVAITVILLAFFSCDVVYSQIHPHTGTGITDMGQITPPQQVCQTDGILSQRQGPPART